MAKRNSVRSRKVAEKMIGRPLKRDKWGKTMEWVHHVNGDPTDDRPENLAVVSPMQHSALHPRPPLNRTKRLRYWRERRGYTQEQLARRAKVTATTIHRLEVGKAMKPHPATLVQLAKALEIRIADLYMKRDDAR